MTLNIQEKGGKVLNAPVQVTSKRKQEDDDFSDGSDDEDSTDSESEEEKENEPSKKNESNKKLKTAPLIEVGGETQINEWDVDNTSLASGWLFFSTEILLNSFYSFFKKWINLRNPIF